MSSRMGKQEPLIVFVCEHGSAKSLIAASFCERMAKERGMAVRAVSRGTAPDDSVPVAVIEALHEDGFDVAAFRPEPLRDADVAGAACVVAIGVDIGAWKAAAGTRLERWVDIPPLSEGYPGARDAIVERLDALLPRVDREP